MSTLHQIQDPSPALLDELANVIGKDDAVILLGRAVALNSLLAGQIGFESAQPSPAVYIRQSDADACGVTTENCSTALLISDDQWVELSLKHSKTISWKQS